MPSVTQSPAFSSSKKRRRDDDGDAAAEVQVPLYGSPKHLHLLQTTRAQADGVFYTSSPQYHHHSHYHPLNSNNEHLVSSSNNNNNNNHRDPGSNSAAVFNLPRKVTPLPVSKRFRALEDDPHEKQDRQRHYNHHHQPDGSTATSPDDRSHRHEQQQQQQQQKFHFSHAHPEYSTSPISPQIQPTMMIKPHSSLLDPCHICHRKPTKKSDLDSFADCMGCGQRTCFVCIRQCQGWLGAYSTATAKEERPEEQQEQNLSASFTMRDVDDEDMNHHYHDETQKLPRRAQNKGGGGRGGPEEGWNGRGHRDVICSRCCVERGSEGDVVCLGCLAGMEEGA